MAAVQFNLSNLTLIVNNNDFQQTASIEKVMNTKPIAAKFESFGWIAVDIDGHDLTAVHEALAVPRRSSEGRPQRVVAHTVKGKGVSFMENDLAWHYKSPDAQQLARALAELEAAP